MDFAKKLYRTLKRLYCDLTHAINSLYTNFIHLATIFIYRTTRKTPKVLILDMDWYRLSLREQEIQSLLYQHPLLSHYVDFVRIERAQIFTGMPPQFELTPENYQEICYEGFNLWGICKATAISILGTIHIDLTDSAHLKEIRRIYAEAAVGLYNLKVLFQKMQPDGAFIFQGGFFESRCVVEIARQFSMNVIGIENSMIGGMIILDNLSGQIINRHSLARLGAELLETCDISAEQRQKTFNIWQEKLTHKSREHKTGGIDTIHEMRKELNLPDGYRILLLLGQVRTDASVVLDSPIFPDPVDMIEQVARCIHEFGDTILLIRLHPKEFSGLSPYHIFYNRSTFQALIEREIDRFSNIRIIEDTRFNTYTLMEMAHAGVTLASQAGFEMCLLRKPVMICGQAFYSRKGFTIDLGHVAALKSTLDFLIHKATMSPEQHKLALNFLYLFYQNHLFDHQLSIHQKRLLQMFYTKPVFQSN